MQILSILIPVSLLLGAGGLAAFFWAMRARQFEDPDGSAHRILIPDWDARPRPGDVQSDKP